MLFTMPSFIDITETSAVLRRVKCDVLHNVTLRMQFRRFHKLVQCEEDVLGYKRFRVL